MATVTGPFAAYSRRRRLRTYGGAMAALVTWGAAMVPSAKRMAAAGTDIVSFELAGSRARVDEILDGWGPDGIAAARTNLLLDQGWLLTYSTALAAAAAEAGHVYADRGWAGAARWAGPIGWGAYVAAALDAVENTSLLALVDGSPSDTLPAVAARAARVKFALVAVALPYGAAGLALGAWTRRRR